MKEFEFTLSFELPSECKISDFIQPLEKISNNISLCRKGYVSLDFSVKAHCMNEAIDSAMNEVFKMIPEAELVQYLPETQ